MLYTSPMAAPDLPGRQHRCKNPGQAASASASLATHRSVLLIEDNLAHAVLVDRCFEDYHAQSCLYWAKDGQEALAYLRHEGCYSDPALSPRPDLILLDLRLPKVSGLEVLHQIRADQSLLSIPVVVLTTSGSEQDVEEAYAHGANAYLVKPGDFEAFTRLIEELGAFWLGWNRVPESA